MQAILTRYHGPTNHKGSRISASCERGKITIPYPYELSGAECHRAAVDALIVKVCREDREQHGTMPTLNPWNRPFVSGQLPNGDYAHVFTDDHEQALAEAVCKRDHFKEGLQEILALSEYEAHALAREYLKSE